MNKKLEQTPGDSRGQRILMCCSPWGCKELDMTEQLNKLCYRTKGRKGFKKGCCLVHKLCPTLCDPLDCIAHQAPLSVAFHRQESWSGLPFPPPRINPPFPTQGSNPYLLHLTGRFFITEPPGKPLRTNNTQSLEISLVQYRHELYVVTWKIWLQIQILVW